MDIAKKLTTDRNLSPIPLREVPWMRTDSARVWLKIEWNDPTGIDPLRSIKRKPAWFIFHDAIQKQYITPNKIVVSATSGNLGIELALLAREHAVPFYCVAPGGILPEGIQVLQEVGANVIRTAEQEVCPREFTVFYTRGYSHEYHHRLVNLDQFYSWLNPLAHSFTTAKEIFENGQIEVDAVFTCLGSCGTIGGILQYVGLRELDVQVFGAQPAKHQGIPGTHVIKGDCLWSPENYSPVVLPEANIVTVDNVDSFAFTVKLWQEGICAGPSTGMALSVAYRKIHDGLRGNIIAISADSNLKYPELLISELTMHRDEIVSRYPEFELAEPIEQYLEDARNAIDEERMVKSIRRHYQIETPGAVFEVQDIEDIVTSR